MNKLFKESDLQLRYKSYGNIETDKVNSNYDENKIKELTNGIKNFIIR